MARWLAILMFLGGLTMTAWRSGREPERQRPLVTEDGGSVTAQDDGGGWPTPPPR